MYRSNGLIDDIVVYGKSENYLSFADFVGRAINSEKSTLMPSASNISVEIICDEKRAELFTSLQNETNDYISMDDWNNRNILRVFGNPIVLANLQMFLVDLAGRGEGYSYLSEYSNSTGYSGDSPEWRLHVEIS